MGWAVIILLASLWASILLPGVVRSRRPSPLESVSAFERSMSLIALRSTGRPGRQIMVLADPPSVTGRSNRARMVARRRATLRGLALLALVAGAAALSAGGVLWWIFASTAVLLAGYLGEVQHQRARRVERARKVRRLPARTRRATRPPVRPVAARRRGA